MVLRGPYNYKGIALNDAYARIDTVSSHDANCTASVNIYANQQAWLSGEGFLEQKYPVVFTKQIGSDVGDDKTQGYGAIRLLPEWQEWEDVFEEGQPI